MSGLAALGLQYLLGALLLVWVLMGVGVIPFRPPAVAPAAEPLRDALFASGYLIPAVMMVYLVSALAFLTNRFVALGALLLFPVSLNILLFHAFLNPRSVPLALVLFLPNSLLLWFHRAAFAPLLRP